MSNGTAIQFELGHARVMILTAGDLRAPLREWFALPDGVLAKLPAHETVPVQCALIELGDSRVLIDAPRWIFGPGREFAMPAGYTAPPSIVEQLSCAGYSAESITHVVITHAHEDHLNALLDGERLTFPNAFCYIGRHDCTWALERGAQGGSAAETARILATLHSNNVLMQIQRDMSIAPGIFVLQTPGETPGHMVVRIHSGGQSLYCLGDLWHHPVEISQDLVVTWAEAETVRHSRLGLALVALQEDAVLMATHIRGIGKLLQLDDTLVWAHGDMRAN